MGFHHRNGCGSASNLREGFTGISHRLVRPPGIHLLQIRNIDGYFPVSARQILAAYITDPGSVEKDTALSRVTVDCIDFDRRRVEQYIFARVQRQWHLVEIDAHALGRHADSEFYTFYNRFATSTDFQMAHIADPFYFKTYDSDNFQTIEGVLDVNQWPDFRPDLPSGHVTSVNYGQSYGQSRRRVLMLCSPSGGMSCSLTFLRMGKTWMLEKLEN